MTLATYVVSIIGCPKTHKVFRHLCLVSPLNLFSRRHLACRKFQSSLNISVMEQKLLSLLAPWCSSTFNSWQAWVLVASWFVLEQPDQFPYGLHWWQFGCCSRCWQSGDILENLYLCETVLCPNLCNSTILWTFPLLWAMTNPMSSERKTTSYSQSWLLKRS